MPAATIEMNTVASTYSLASGTSEVAVFTFTPTNRAVVWGIWLDMVNLTQNATIRATYQIDGTTARTFRTTPWTTGDDDGVLLEGTLPVDDSLSVTIQSTVAEGASRNIPYEYHYQSLGAGAITFTYTLTDNANNQPIADADIWITTDSAGTNIVASGITDSSGEVVAYLGAGTYYVWRAKSGWNFVNPDQETVS